MHVLLLQRRRQWWSVLRKLTLLDFYDHVRCISRDRFFIPASDFRKLIVFKCHCFFFTPVCVVNTLENPCRVVIALFYPRIRLSAMSWCDAVAYFFHLTDAPSTRGDATRRHYRCVIRAGFSTRAAIGHDIICRSFTLCLYPFLP